MRLHRQVRQRRRENKWKAAKVSATKVNWLMLSPLRQGNVKRAATKEMLAKK